MYRIIFLDIDGTLRDEAYGIPDTAKNAIKMSQLNGSYICLCTGRTVGTIPSDVLNLDIDGIIAGGGAYIEFHHKILRNDFFDKGKLEKVKLYLNNQHEKVAFTLETEEMIFMNKEAVKILNNLNEEKFKLLSDKERRIVKESQKIIYEDNIHKFDSLIHQVSKICLWSVDKVFRGVENIFSNSEIQLAQSFRFDHRHYYEIIQKDCNKGQAIVTLCNYLKIPVNQTLAFGDGRNDIDMLKTVGTAIGMKNGSKEIFKYVDSICESPMKDGIYLELKRRRVI